MSDPLFTTSSNQAMLNARLNRVEGAIPYIRSARQVFSSSSVKAPASSAVNPVLNSTLASGTIVPNTGIQAVGNAFPFVIQGKFGFSATPTSITLYWDGTNGSKIFAIKRTDGTNFTIPAGNLLISGLFPLTQYGFLPYNKITSPTQLSFSIGDAGNPQFAFSPSASPDLIAAANQNQSNAGNESVTNSFIYFTTPSSGTDAGQGTPGLLPAYPGGDNRPL